MGAKIAGLALVVGVTSLLFTVFNADRQAELSQRLAEQQLEASGADLEVRTSKIVRWNPEAETWDSLSTVSESDLRDRLVYAELRIANVGRVPGRVEGAFLEGLKEEGLLRMYCAHPSGGSMVDCVTPLLAEPQASVQFWVLLSGRERSLSCSAPAETALTLGVVLGTWTALPADLNASYVSEGPCPAPTAPEATPQPSPGTSASHLGP